MEFRLVYQGPLLVTGLDKNKRTQHKQEIRKKLHRQLKELWNTHHALARLPTISRHVYDAMTMTESHWSRLDELANAYTRSGFRFAPLICRHYGLLCSLDILYLRRGAPGKVIYESDLDNSIKTLLDALRMPSEDEIQAGANPDETENPFFVLLEDDAFVTQMKITTDRLLVPQDESGDELVATTPGEKGASRPLSKVYLVICVRTLVADPERAYAEFSL
jgi:hypothetical protein